MKIKHINIKYYYIGNKLALKKIKLLYDLID